MTGMFELFTDSDASYRFRLTAPDGTVMALSRPFPDRRAAVAGIAAVREYAGMGLVREITPPRIRIPSPARFLRGRAVTRNRQMITRWRRALGAQVTPARLSPC